MARKSWRTIASANASRARKAKSRKKALSKNSTTGTLTRVKSLLFKGARGKKNGNTGYVGRIAKGKYLYRTKKTR